jgi:hypothetical protein
MFFDHHIPNDVRLILDAAVVSDKRAREEHNPTSENDPCPNPASFSHGGEISKENAGAERDVGVDDRMATDNGAVTHLDRAESALYRARRGPI